MGKAKISEHLLDLITSIMKKATMELIRKEAKERLNESTKTKNVTQRKGGIQQEIEYADLCKTIQNRGRWERESNKRNINQVATEDEKSVENTKNRHLGRNYQLSALSRKYRPSRQRNTAGYTRGVFLSWGALIAWVMDKTHVFINSHK